MAEAIRSTRPPGAADRGCGGGGDDGAAPAATVQAASAEVFVDTPDNGEAVKAKRVLGDRLAGDVTVSGTTGAGAVVVVQATCEEETRLPHVDDRGRGRGVRAGGRGLVGRWAATRAG